MRELQGRKRARGVLYSWPMVALLAFLIVMLGRGVWGAYQKESYAEMKSAESARELAELRDREGALTAKAARLETDRGKEEEIREKFLVGKEGEGVIYIAPLPDVPKEEGVRDGGFWTGFLEWFR